MKVAVFSMILAACLGGLGSAARAATSIATDPNKALATTVALQAARLALLKQDLGIAKVMLQAATTALQSEVVSSAAQRDQTANGCGATYTSCSSQLAAYKAIVLSDASDQCSVSQAFRTCYSEATFIAFKTGQAIATVKACNDDLIRARLALEQEVTSLVNCQANRLGVCH